MQMHAEQHKRNNGDFFFFFGKLINKYGSHETMLLGAKKKHNPEKLNTILKFAIICCF